MQEYKTMTVVALKVLTLTNKLGLYFSNMSHKSLVSLYQKISTTWKLILTNKLKHSADNFRGSSFIFINLCRCKHHISCDCVHEKSFIFLMMMFCAHHHSDVVRMVIKVEQAQQT